MELGSRFSDQPRESDRSTPPQGHRYESAVAVTFLGLPVSDSEMAATVAALRQASPVGIQLRGDAAEATNEHNEITGFEIAAEITPAAMDPFATPFEDLARECNADIHLLF